MLQTQPPGMAASLPQRSTRARSWSWASLDCPVLFTSDDGDRYAAKVSVLRHTPHSVATDTTPILEIECQMLHRSTEELTKDKLSGTVRIIMDLDADELGQEGGDVHYMLLCRNIGPDEWGAGIKPVGPLRLWYVSGLVVRAVTPTLFKRLGYFRWDLGDSLGDEPSFGSPRPVVLA